MNSNALIENYFIEPLEKHYEAKPKPGVRLTILGELSGCDEATLTEAVAYIKRTRKAMTFPSPAECVAATKAQGNVAKLASRITGPTYARQAAEFARGMKAVPVIQKWADAEKTRFTPQWEAWQGYWEALGAASTINLARDRDSWTVPTDWPYQFDSNARYSAGDPEGHADAAASFPPPPPPHPRGSAARVGRPLAGPARRRPDRSKPRTNPMTPTKPKREKTNPLPGRQTSKAVASKAAKGLAELDRFAKAMPGIRSALMSALAQVEK